MNAFIPINPEHSGHYYALFYLLAFLAGFGILMRQGYKRNLPLIPWMMVVATAFLFFMLGCRLIGFSNVEWSLVRQLESIPYATRLSVLGGILLSIPAILLAKMCLRFKHETVDAFAFVIPFALMIQRFGCFLAGCCYGTPVELPWSVQYGAHSHAYVQHLNEGLLANEATASLPLHPVQIYEILGCLLIVMVLIRLRKLLRAPGNLFLASVGLYGVIRFGLEFVRAPQGHAIGGQFIFHLNLVQWSILLILPMLLCYVLLKEIKFETVSMSHSHAEHTLARPIVYFCLLISFFIFASRWMNNLEVISFQIVLAPMLAGIAWKCFTSVTVPGYRIASLILPLGAFVLMSQTLPEQSKTADTKISYTTFSAGWLGGNTNLSNTTSSAGYTDCSGRYVLMPSTTTVRSDNTYSMGAIGFSHTDQIGPEKFISWGINGFQGTHTEEGYYDVSTANGPTNNHISQDLSYLGFKPYLQYDTRDVGVGFGLAAGQMGYIQFSTVEASSVRQVSTLPAFNLRLGHLSGAFIEYKLNNQFPSALPASFHQFDVGIGFGKGTGGAFRVGTATNVSVFLAPTIPLGENYVLEPYLGFGGGISSITKSDGFLASLSLHYKFNKKEKPMIK